MAQQSDLQIDIVSDVVCPWCILGYKQLETALTLEGFSAEIRWHPFELNPHMPVGGQNLRQHLAKKYGTTLENSIKARKRLTEMGAELGFSFAYTDDMRMYNTNLAHQLLYWAKESAADPLATVHALKMALFEAFFTHRKPLDEIETLVAIAETIGLPGVEARQALEDQRYRDNVREAEQHWQSLGIHGVPAVIFEGKHLVSGAQGVEGFRHILRSLRAGQAA